MNSKDKPDGKDFVFNREELYDRIDGRVDNMLNMGLLEEVRRLVDMNLPSDCTAMQAIGYKEMVDVISGKRDIDAASDMIKMESRRYAKRQLTWLRRDTGIEWIMRDESLDTFDNELGQILSHVLHHAPTNARINSVSKPSDF
jgi:tRNA dimethylallyltransferase